MPKPIIPNGALPDPRPLELRKSDYKAQDLPALGVVTPFQHAKPTVLGATKYSQEYVGSCVLHMIYTQLEYEGICPATGMSQLRAYRKRANYPDPGTAAVDGYTKVRGGQSTNSEFPTKPNMTEAMATAMAYVTGTKLLPEFNYYDFEGLAFWQPDGNADANHAAIRAVAAGKAVGMFIFATEEEWSQEYVTIKNPNLSIGNAYVRHAVVLMPNGDFTENGKQLLAVHDSAAFGNRHLRYIPVDFFIKRAYYASQVFKKGEAPVPPAFHYVFTKQLKYNGKNNDPKELKAMQQALQFLKNDGKPFMTPGIFGPFGPQTKKALGLFQSSVGIIDPSGMGTNFGPITRSKMNALLSA